MTKIIFFLLLVSSTLTAQINLIEPIRESEPMSPTEARAFAGVQAFRNWGIEKLALTEIMKTQKGAGIKVCICDTGRPDHNDLNGNISEAANFSSDPTEFDGHGHSTHVAGIIHEIAPEARLYFAKVLNTSGSGTNEGVAKGLDWCIEKKANIINLSLGGPSPSTVIKKSIDEAVKQGITIVAAAGNNGQSETQNKMGYPARYNETIAIGSINDLLKTSYFSSSGDEGDIMAPGEKILSTWLGGGYIVLSGTSMSTPFISGVAGLYIEKYGTIEGFETIFETNATDIPPTGFDRHSFWGYVTPEKMFRDTIQPEPEPDPEPEPEKPAGWQKWIFWIILGVIIGLIALFTVNKK